jgi:hypothetical protein
VRIRPSRRRYRVPPLVLESAPLRDAWHARAGQDFLAFVDESFFRFLGGFDRPEGNFTHGNVCVPATEVQSFVRELAPLVKEYAAEAKLKGLASDEVKFRVFRQLPDDFQAEFVTVLAESLARRAGFVAAFHASVRGLVMERVRSNLVLGGASRVPDDCRDLYDVGAQELTAAREEARGQSPGESWLIERLILSPVSGLTHFAAAVGIRLRFVYDPRTTDRAEDDHVAANVVKMMDTWVERIDPSLAGACLGFSSSDASDALLGLQLADIMAGESRRLFLNLPALLKIGQTKNLITQASRERTSVYWLILGRLMKTGRVTKIPAATLRALMTVKPGHLWPLFNPVLASGTLTCVTDFGTLRHLMPFEGVFLDGTD